MQSYRIYALILGQTLKIGDVFECVIGKMSFDEQVERTFAPIQSIYSDNELTNFHKTYVSYLRYIDPIKIKSEYVIYCNIEEESVNAALGGAIKIIDRVVRYLSLACLEDVNNKFGRDRGSFLPYVYQVNRIYEINAAEEESPIDFHLESGHIYLPNRPEQIKWMDNNTDKFLDDIYNFPNDILERSLKYLYRSSIGHLLLDSAEKRALDHFKSIEIIINSLSKKYKFKEKLKDAAIKINISDAEIKRIEDFWDQRSTYGDIAHPSSFDQVERYPNQFPLPSNGFGYGGTFDSIAPNIILKYFNYIRGIFHVTIDEPGKYGQEGEIIKVYQQTMRGSSHLNNLVFITSEKNKAKLLNLLKKAFIKEYGLKDDQVLDIQILPTKDRISGNRTIELRIVT